MPTSPLDTIKALVVCLLAAWGYDAVIAPMLVGDVRVAEIPLRAPSDIVDSKIADYFKPGSWQRDSPKRIETEIGVLLFKDWQRLSDNRWKLSPVTLLLRNSDAGEERRDDGDVELQRPILLEAPGGAEIEFAESLSVLDGSTPPVQGGHLIGNVQIIGPATKADGSDRLQINASEVRINGEKIWTTAPVRVQVGEAVAEGRDLTIAMAGGGKIPTQQSESPLSVLNDLTLIYLDRLQVPLPQGTLWPVLPEVLDARPAGAIPPEGVGGMLNVRCGGAMRFDFATYTLSLSNQVVIEHQGPGLPVDTIRCPNLAIELEDPFGNSVAKPATDRMIRRVRAYGGMTTFDAPTLMSRVSAERIDADFRNGVIKMSGSRGIDFVHRQMQFVLTDFEYRFAPGNPEDLIQLKSNGEGRLIAHDPEMPLRSFSWKDQLRITPQAQDNQYQLWMLQASAVLPEDGRIHTNSLGLGFTLLPANAVKDVEDSKLPLKGRFRPESLVAKGNVVFDTREVYAATDQLDLFIEQIGADATPEQQMRLNRATGETLRLWTREPDESKVAANGVANGSEQQPMASRPRPRIRGKTLSANILTDGRNAVAHEFSINESVRIEHVLESEQGPLPVVLIGRELIFVDGDAGRIIQVSGFPAQIEIADGYFRGPMVQLRMGDNSLFMDRAGEFQMPSTVLSTTASPNFRWVTSPKCSWQGQMHFNGQTAQLVRDVTMSGAVTTLDEPTRWDLQVGCDLLELTLARRIDLSKPGTSKQVDVEKISFRGVERENKGVILSAVQRDLFGNLMGSHQLHVPTLDVMPPTSQLLGTGPGWYHAWSKPKPTDSGPLATLSKTGGWLAAHLVYQEKIEGNIADKVLRFVRGVRVATSPVANEEQRIDARKIVEAQPGQAVLDCDQLEFSQTPAAHQFKQPGQSFGQWEAKAISNVSFQGRNEKGLFSGTADRMGYIADKDLFVMEGIRNRPVELQRRYANGQPGGAFQAQLLKFKPRTLEILDLQIQSVDLGNLQQGFGVPSQPQAANPTNQQPPRF
ncbi:MAG: hypothetical protein R3C05_26140 [Pirellulaceae bacterium]